MNTTPTMAAVCQGNFEEAAVKTLRKMRLDTTSCDVMLQGKSGDVIQAHRSILRARSIFFEQKIVGVEENHPIIYSFESAEEDDLKLLVDFIYLGECKVSEERLEKFLEIGHSLMVDGLWESNTDEDVETNYSKCEKLVKSIIPFFQPLHLDSQYHDTTIPNSIVKREMKKKMLDDDSMEYNVIGEGTSDESISNEFKLQKSELKKNLNSRYSLNKHIERMHELKLRTELKLGTESGKENDSVVYHSPNKDTTESFDKEKESDQYNNSTNDGNKSSLDGSLEQHQNKYERVKRECTQCQKIFYHRGTLNRHIKEVCNKSKLLNEDSTPQRHLPTVQGKIKLKCSLCEFVGIDKGSVLIHLRNTHG